MHEENDYVGIENNIDRGFDTNTVPKLIDQQHNEHNALAITKDMLNWIAKEYDTKENNRIEVMSSNIDNKVYSCRWGNSVTISNNEGNSSYCFKVLMRN